MINLLSPADKRQLVAARHNVVLLRYNFIALFTIFVVGLIYVGAFFVTTRDRIAAQEQLNEDNTRTISYQNVRTEIQEFSKNLSTAKAILSNEVVYSTLITDIAKSLPNGTVLTSLTLTPGSFGKQMSLSAAAKNYTRALELKSSLEKSDLFSDVSIESIGNAGPDNTSTTGYGLTVTLKATLETEAQIKAAREDRS
ncbi:Fimbrial assembly family protein [candidate division TM7 genomosp. GTL1]|nr:Fimbrial assembly family protein [candidate division TM7 genomosp. GTL1]